MNRRLSLVWILIAIVCCWTACKNDVTSAGEAVLGEDDAIIVFVDTFSLSSSIDSCDAIVSQADSFLLGEIETDYGLLRASILTQLACPEGFSYPAGAQVDSICLFMYYASWVGDKNAPLSIDVYSMDKKTFSYSESYKTDVNINEYCSRSKSVLTNHHIVVASEKFDSIRDANGNYLPMMRMRVNDVFMNDFWAMQSFTNQDDFNQQFYGLLIESTFGSATMLNISDIALGVYYHFGYKKRPTDENDTIVYDMKAFYANSEVRTVNSLVYPDRKEWIEKLQQQNDSFNYIIAPAGAYTRIVFPMAQMTDSIMSHMTDVIDGVTDTTKRPYVNKAEVRIAVENVKNETGRNGWLKPSSYMLLIKEESMQRFFDNRELPTDTCALLGALTQGQDSEGEAIYYYTYDMSDFLTNQLRKQTTDTELKMCLVPVTVNSSTAGVSESIYAAVRQQQTMSVTKIRSAKNGMKLEIVYSGFALPTIKD